MAGEVVLVKAWLAGVAWGLFLATSAQADENDGGLYRPKRITAGIADQYLGQLTPDGKTLYFVSSRNTTSELFQEDVSEGRTHLVFDEDAEVTWPRISADGKSVLYISYRDRAEGQLCIRTLPAGKSRRCLEIPAAAMQAEWIDHDRIALVARASVQSDLSLLEVKIAKTITTRTLVAANISSPAISPDGRWLLYVPLERYGDRIGAAFASHVAKHLAVINLGHAGSPIILPIDLPGSTGQPVFSRDGRSLFIAQFFSDSNHDGVVDGNDHGVLFRVPISFANGQVVTGDPVQLTDTGRNCQYPQPTAHVLVATCMSHSNLDVYSMPLDGEVPSDWTAEHLTAEIELTNQRAVQLLLFRHRLALETTVATRRRTLLELTRLHVDLEEFRAAEFYVSKLTSLGDAATSEIALPLATLIAHRRDMRARERGREVEDFPGKSKERMATLARVAENHDRKSAALLAHVVRSEIADATGDKTLARSELEQGVLTDTAPLGVVDFYYERADAFYREVDDREALVALCQKLAQRPKEDADASLRFARAAVRASIRGLRVDEADAELARQEIALSSPDSELAFALNLARKVLKIRTKDVAVSVRDELLAFYSEQTRIGRRRAIILDAVQRATQVGADHVIEKLAERYVDDAQKGTQERRRAERLYSRAITGRAFRREASNHLKEARADFEAVAQRTDSYEAVVGAIDLRLREGESRNAIDADYLSRRDPPALKAFVGAYLLATSLTELHPNRRADATKRALAKLETAWSVLKDKGPVQSLFGALMHERYLETHDDAFAERANVHYLIGLDLARTDPRTRALILGQLGMLHTEVGNFRIALGYLEERDALPYMDDAAGLAVRMAKARALMHVGREKDAAASADAAVAMVDRSPNLASYRAFALDRAALDHFAAHHFEQSLALYDRLIPIVDAAPDTDVARHNRFVSRLGRSAAAVGAKAPKRALDDLTQIDRDLANAQVTNTLQWANSSHEHVLRTYRLLSAGLRAHALADLDRTAEEQRALEDRRALLALLFSRSNRNEHLRELSLVESQLADTSSLRHDPTAAARNVSAALDHADTLHSRTSDPFDPRRLDVIWLAAKLATFDSARLDFDLQKRLAAEQVDLSKRTGSAARTFASWFEIYSVLAPHLTAN